MPGVSEPTGDALTPGASAEAHLGAVGNVSFTFPPGNYASTSPFPEASEIKATPLNVPYAICEILVAIAAVAGNALVLAAFRRERKLRRRTNYYIVSLAAADFLVGLLGIPVAVLASVGLPNGLHACLLAVCLLLVLCTISIFCLVAVSVDRYWAILHPMAYSRNVRTKTAVAIICVCWIAGTFVGFLPLLGWNAGPQPQCLFTEVMDYDYLVFLYFATIIFPALLLAAFYAHIYRVVLRQLRKKVSMHSGRRRKESMLRLLGTAQRREIKTTQSLAIIVLFFIISWMPLHTINFVKALCPDCPVEGPITFFSIVLSHLNSAVNPILYAYHLKDYRAALRAILLCNKDSKIQETSNRNKPIPTISQTPSKPKDNILEVQHPQDADPSTKSLSLPDIFSPENLVNAPISSFLGDNTSEQPSGIKTDDAVN